MTPARSSLRSLDFVALDFDRPSLHPLLRSAALALLVALSASSGPALAQDGRDQTDLQDEAEAGIRAVCRGLAALNAEGALVGLQVDLFTRCNEMVETANDLDGFTDPNSTDASLGLTGAELAGAWQQLSGEEAATQGALGTEASDSQLENLGSRLAAIRRGASGFSIADLGLVGDAGAFRIADLGIPAAGYLEEGSDDDLGSVERWGIFLNGTVGFGDKEATGREDPFDVDTSGVTLGLDYRFSDRFVAGLAVGAASLDAELLATSSGTVAGGGVESDGTSVSLYFTGFGDKFYVDGSAVFGDDEYDMERRIVYTSRTSRDSQDRVATSATDGSRSTFTLGVGYDGQRGAVSFGPYARISSMAIEIDGYAESDAGAAELALVFGDQEIDSLLSTVGFELGRVVSLDRGVLGFQVSAEWNHEFDDDPRTIAAHYKFDPNELPFDVRTDEPDRDYYMASVGLVGVFTRGWQAFLNVDSVFGRETIDFTQVSGGVRFGF